jgi:hypothetical protein
MNNNNNIYIGVMSGGLLQQGTRHSHQSASNSFDREGAQAALTSFTEALKTLSLPADKLTDLQANLDTVRAQLAKPAPSLSIIQEAGRSVRNLIEGVMAGMLTGPAMTYAQYLIRALGLYKGGRLSSGQDRTARGCLYSGRVAVSLPS